MRVLQGRGTPLGNGGVSIGDPTGQWGDSLWGQGSGSPHGGPTGQRQPPSGETGPPTPGLSPPLTLAAAPAAAVLALAGPGTGAGVTWGGRAAVSRGTGRDGTGRAQPGRGTYRRHTCSPGGPWFGLAWFRWLRLGSARSSTDALRPRVIYEVEARGGARRCARRGRTALPRGRAQRGAVLSVGPCSPRGRAHPGAVPWCRAHPGPGRAQPGARHCCPCRRPPSPRLPARCGEARGSHPHPVLSLRPPPGRVLHPGGPRCWKMPGGSV